ncbi:T9SS type A sorting domain-containing protein [Psychroflexus sp. CAK8W]|uniref:T9SS type A sorting domain-containing protein n=1 Tax=Psychroflexus longus TaxID=2873596 RepID=A0ABS7XFI6_9FLAO|nr:T9SS type A sorting domain-containing protein [Psychroflexus longus]MBZ9777727.1 T9SS type A sorting domain-containing protein [Psychroflexus longus]
MNKLLHPRYLGLLIILLFTAPSISAQDVIHCWDFNGTTPYASPINIDNRSVGDGAIEHNLDMTNVTDVPGSTTASCDGAAAGKAIRIRRGDATSGNNGKHLDLKFSTLGFETIGLRFFSSRTTDGFDDNDVLYSIDGGSNFTQFIQYSPSGGGNFGSANTIDFSSIQDVNNNENFVIRIILRGATSDTGDNVIDNVQLLGTPISTNDDDSVVVVDPAEQVPAKTIIAADVTTTSQAESIFTFDIQDAGTSDGLPTTVTKMQFEPATGNTADLPSTLNSLILKDETGTAVSGTFDIFGGLIEFTPSPALSIPDGLTQNFTIEAVLSDETGIIDDGSVIQLQINTNADFQADASGSQFADTFPADIVGNLITIDVEATKIVFSQQPTDTNVNNIMDPAVEVSFVDVYGNLDTDQVSAVELSSTGDLDGQPVSEPAVDGVAAFSNLTHSAAGSGLTMEAVSGSFTEIISTTYNIAANDLTSEVVGPGTQVGPDILEAVDASVNAKEVFRFDISDLGGDNVPTEVNQMRFVPATNNSVDWSTDLQQVIINDVAAGTSIAGTFSITTNEIIFTPDSPVIVGEGSVLNFSVDILLNSTGIDDQSVIQFQVEGTDSGFTAEPTGSLFNSSFTNGSVVGNEFTVDVVATQLAFLEQPTDVEVGDTFVPTVQVGFVDANGNIDTSKTSNVEMSSSGGVSNLPFTVSASGGIASFPTIVFSEEALGLTLTAETTDTSLTSSQLIESNSFNVQNAIIAIQDFDGTTPEWTYTPSIVINSGWGTSYFNVIDSGAAFPLASSSFINNIFGVNNLNTENSGSASLDFDPIDVTGFTDVNVSFDWEVNGYDTTSDFIQYEVLIDGSNTGTVSLFTGDSGASDGSGTVNVTIPDGTQTVALRIIVQDTGADDYFGVDNVKLTGNSNARDTDIIASDPQIPAGTLIADVNNEIGQAVEVFSFEVVDSGNFDNLPTNITQLRFVAGTANSADWSNEIQGISISDGTNTLIQANQTVTINPNEILLSITGDPDTMFEVADGTRKVYTVSVYLNGGGITDGEVIQLAIAEGNQGQLASSDGSIFSQDITAFEGNAFNIEVIGTQLEFFEQPTTTFVGVSMSPSVRVRNLDAKGNVDLDNTVNISITSTGVLSGNPVSRNISSSLGYANFNTLQHTATGFDLTLTASTTSGPTSIDSDEFNIILESTLLISEVIDPSGDSNGRYVELFNMDVEPIDLDDQNYFLINPSGTGESIQLTGQIIPPKSYFIISFTDNANFNPIYERDADFVASSTLGSDGTEIYQLSFDVNEPRAILDVYGDAENTGWEFTGQRAYRNIPTVRESNSTYTSSEWILESASVNDATPGVGDNDFVYNGDWTTTGLGDPEASNTGSNPDKSIFIESGTVTLTGSNTISDVVVRDGATLIIEDAITLNGDFANFTSSQNGKVTFRSTESKTAVLGIFDATNRKLVGNNYEIERYIPASNRAFRYLSSPVTTALSPKPTIRDNWQEGVNNTETIVDGEDPNNQLGPDSGYGTHITGSKPDATDIKGFDVTLTGNPSMFEWNASNQSWNAIPNTNSKGFNAGEAYAILIRGDRSTTLNSNTAVGPATTLRTTGRLVVGSRGVDKVGSSTGDFSLIGNPYQARINLTEFMNGSSGVSTQFVYIYDATLGTRGGYATVDLATGTNEISEPTPPTSDATNILEPNQSFFVETTLELQAVVYSESYKASEVGGNVAFSVPEPVTNLYVNLYYDNIDTKAVDAVKVKFRAGANNAKDTLDATKVWNYDEWFAIDRNPNYMSIESRDMPTAQDSVPFYLGNFTKTAYRFEIKPENFTSAKAYLFDRYLETSTELPSEATTAVSFEIDNSIPASKAPNRFVIKFEEVSLSDDNFELNSSLSVYPNPLQGMRFSISHQQAFEGKDLSLKLFDLQGRMIINQTIENTPNVEVNLNKELASGVYILNLSDGKASQSVKLMVK